MMRVRAGARRRAFSVVELVIVIAIVALLASFLMPAAGRARDQAALVSCRTHLRNVGLALTVYAEEHNGALPVGTQVDGPHDALLGALAGYLSQSENFFCPSETRPERRFSPENVQAGRIGYFYYSCRRASNNQNVSGFLRYDVRWPRELRLPMEANTWVLSDVWFRGEATPHDGFRKGTNFLTLDGAVDLVEESPRKAFR